MFIALHRGNDVTLIIYTYLYVTHHCIFHRSIIPTIFIWIEQLYFLVLTIVQLNPVTLKNQIIQPEAMLWQF